jgi:hypothetical protein
MVVWRVPAESLDDADRVGAALEWATQDPALLERDGQGHYRPVPGMLLPVGSRRWQEHHRAAAASGVLTPLELVEQGDSDRGATPADLAAAEASYRLAMDGDDPDAAALASLRLAELAEERDRPAQAARRYAEVAALGHPVASPPAVLWLARQAALDGDRPAARVLAHEVVSSGDGSLLPAAWALLASLAWFDDDKGGRWPPCGWRWTRPESGTGRTLGTWPRCSPHATTWRARPTHTVRCWTNRCSKARTPSATCS